MKKIGLLFVLGFVYATTLQAQKVNTCGFKIPPKSLRINFKSVYEAAAIVKNMTDTVSWAENFKLKEQNGINNAYATMLGQVRYIIYDNDFLENLDTYAATKWASISVLAHEIGHHYFNHVLKSTGSTVPKEIEADKFSGYVMQRLGATLEQAKAAMQKVGTDKETTTHPAKKDRLAAITFGWEKAKKEKGDIVATNNGGIKPPADQQGGGIKHPTDGGIKNPNNGGVKPPPNNPNYDPTIALYINSTKDETVMLSDDGKTYVPATIPAGEAFVFTFEIYSYGFLKLPYFNGYRTFKLEHGKDYNIIWNRRTKNYTVVEITN
jgi:hypothetical protein